MSLAGIDRPSLMCREGVMDALERFLLVATGDEMAGSLNTLEAQVPPPLFIRPPLYFDSVSEGSWVGIVK
jgi:hypothetical protein